MPDKQIMITEAELELIEQDRTRATFMKYLTLSDKLRNYNGRAQEVMRTIYRACFNAGLTEEEVNQMLDRGQYCFEDD